METGEGYYGLILGHGLALDKLCFGLLAYTLQNA